MLRVMWRVMWRVMQRIMQSEMLRVMQSVMQRVRAAVVGGCTHQFLICNCQCHQSGVEAVEDL